MDDAPAALLAALLVTVLAAVAVVVHGPSGGGRTPVGAPASPTLPAPAASSPGPSPAGRVPAGGGVLAALPVAPAPSAARLRSALARPAAARALGRLSAVVLDARSGRTLFARSAGTPVPPASTTKLLTAVTALGLLGPTARLTTRVVRTGHASIVLVGGGDPTLCTARFAPAVPGCARIGRLATRTAAALRSAGVRRVRLGYDTTRYAGPARAAGWKPNYVTEGDVAPVSALEVDEGRLTATGRGRTRRPATAAVTLFARLLKVRGIAVLATPRPARVAAGTGALAEVHSPPVADLVESMLTNSDNDLAEALGRAAALAAGRSAGFAGAAATLTARARSLGLAGGIRLADASGLSTRDRIPVARTAGLLSAAVDRPALRTVLSGLPVAGFAGTLAERFRTGSARSAAGLVRAKTGSLSGVNALAGVVPDRDGALLAFAFVARGDSYFRTVQAALDRLAAAVGRVYRAGDPGAGA